MPFGDVRISGFFTDRDVPLLITTTEDENGKENAKKSRRKWNKTGEPMIESSN